MDTAILPEQTASDVPLFKKRGTKNIRKRPATPPPAASDSEESGYTSTEDEGRRIKRRRKTAIIIASSNAAPKTTTEDLYATKFAADRTTKITETNDATKQSNWFDEKNTDAKNLLGTTRALPSKEDDGPASDGTYKGVANYQSYIQKNPNAPTRTVGPVKAPTNIRTITVTDFAPDVCKDYKQTGFCGFGDSCKFLHAREDYKQGWEQDKDWEIATKGKKKGQPMKTLAEAEDSQEEDKALEGIPFACIICKKPYTNPIVTRCGHYFCEACALQRYRKNPSCAACGAGTGGVFNGAKNLRKILDKKRERARIRREKMRENGEDVSSDDEGAVDAS
ncbi:hypothetical protein N7G274_003381 [Stereocaulon virgatum]|uniref:Pre-mRNA-splicing factor CWC24 n=1 Tax=Stereocaulon virgatum TaxID=373712 RepID=A0ABR4AGB1_9LECA